MKIQSVVFFDGVCGLCNRFIDFLVRYDTHHRLLFSSLQGIYIHKTRAGVFFKEDSIVFLQGDKVFVKSRAIIESVAALGGVWKISKCLLLIPRWPRDKVYDIVARHRYGWFGKNEACRIPKREEQPFFLE